MSTKPVLVVHGIANHDEAEFVGRVATLGAAIRQSLPDVKLIPVFWGDLGGRSTSIVDCLPQLVDGQWTTRAEGVLAMAAAGEEVRGGPPLSNEQRAEIIAGARSGSLVRGEADPKQAAILEALVETRHLQKIGDIELLRAIGNIVDEALADGAAGRVPTPGQFETRRLDDMGPWIRRKVKQVLADMDHMVGKLVEDGLGALNQRLRASLMNGLAATLGDIVAYSSNKQAIQHRLWEAIDREAPGHGTEASPIAVIAHSLGGVIAFDAMAAPAGPRALYTDSFVTFGSQPAFFQIVDPRITSATYSTGHPITLPATIRRWFNLWDVVDLLAFTASTVFELSDGGRPVDIPVEDPVSKMLDAKLWLHSVYWETPQLRNTLGQALRAT